MWIKRFLFSSLPYLPLLLPYFWRTWLGLGSLCFQLISSEAWKSANCTVEPWDKSGNNLNSQSNSLWREKFCRGGSELSCSWDYLSVLDRLSRVPPKSGNNLSIRHHTRWVTFSEEHTHHALVPSDFFLCWSYLRTLSFKSFLFQGIPLLNENKPLVGQCLLHTLLCTWCYVAG